MMISIDIITTVSLAARLYMYYHCDTYIVKLDSIEMI